MQLSPSGRQGCPLPRGGGNAPQAPYFDHNNNGPPPAHAWFHPNQNQRMGRFQQPQPQQQYNDGIPPPPPLPPPTANGRYSFNNYSGSWEWYPDVNFQPHQQQQNSNQLGGALSNFIQGFLMGQNNNNNNNNYYQQQQQQYPPQYQHPNNNNNNNYGYVAPLQENIFLAADYKGLPMIGSQNHPQGDYFSPSSSSPTVASRLLFANSESPFHRHDSKKQNNNHNSKNNKITSMTVAALASIFTIHSASFYISLIRKITLSCGTYLCVVGTSMLLRSEVWLLTLLPEVMYEWNLKENIAFSSTSSSSTLSMNTNNKRKESTYFKNEEDDVEFSSSASSSSSFLPSILSSQMVGVALLIFGSITIHGAGFGRATKRNASFLFFVGALCLYFVMSDDFHKMNRNFNDQHQFLHEKKFNSDSNGFFYDTTSNTKNQENNKRNVDDPTFPARKSAGPSASSTNKFHERSRNTNIYNDDDDETKNEQNSRSRQEQKLSNHDLPRHDASVSNSNEAQRGYISRFFSLFVSRQKVHNEGIESDLNPFGDGGYLGRKKSFLQKLGTSFACYSGFQAWMLTLCGIALLYLDFCALIAL